MALVAWLLALLGGLLAGLMGNEIYARGGAWSRRIIALAADRLPEALRDRFREEWSSHAAEVEGNLAKVGFSLSCLAACGSLRRIFQETEYELKLVFRHNSQTWGRASATLDAATFLAVVSAFVDVPADIRIDLGDNYRDAVDAARQEVALTGAKPNAEQLQELRRRVAALPDTEETR